MTKVFISYSRKDKDFAGRLTETLEKSELETWIDWEDIPPTADWMDQIHKGIEQADAFLFLLSPDSVASKICGKEVDHAVQNGKRLIPIVAREVNPNDVHPALGKVNWIYARESDDFDSAVSKTLSAIRTDLAWVESHRRLQVRALEWDRRKDGSLLLRGKDLREAEEQLASAGKKDPQPTDMQRRYVLESRRRESRTRNIFLSIGLAVSIFLACATIISIMSSINATRQANAASTARADAVDQANVASTARAVAESERSIALSNGLASNALLLKERLELPLAFLLSVQGNKFAETARSKNTLFTLLQQNEYLMASLAFPDTLLIETLPSVRIDSKGEWLVASLSDFNAPDQTSDTQYILWDLKTYQQVDDKIFPKGTYVSVDPATRQLLPNESGTVMDGMLLGDSLNELYLGSLGNQVEETWTLADTSISMATHCKFFKSMSGWCSNLGIFVFTNNDPFFTPKNYSTPQSAVDFLGLAYDQSNQLFALANAGNGALQIWQENNGELLLSNTLNDTGFTSRKETKGVAFLPSQNLIAWGTQENKIVVLDIGTKQTKQEYIFDFAFTDFEISPDGMKLAMRSDAGVRLYSLDTGQPQPMTVSVPVDIAGAMGFDESGQILAVGSGNQIWVFNVISGEQITQFEITSVGDSEVENVFVSSDGSMVGVGMNPVAVGPLPGMYLIDIQTGAEMGPFKDVYTPVISPDNTHLVSMGPWSNQNIYEWTIDLASWEERACQIADRNLTHAEWSQYIGNMPYQLTCPNFPDPDLASAP